MSKKNKKGSWLWEILLPEPRVICLKLSFLTDIKIFFEIKVLKKTSTLAHMSGYYHIVSHVNMHCSGTTYSHFCLKHLAKKALKKASYPEIPPKNKQKILPWKLRHPKTCSKWRTWGVRNRNVKKIKGLLALGDFTPRTKSNLLETFVSNRY